MNSENIKLQIRILENKVTSIESHIYQEKHKIEKLKFQILVLQNKISPDEEDATEKQASQGPLFETK